jgi:hypothetical protein
MFDFNLKSANKHMVALASLRACEGDGLGYWAVGFTGSNEQDPIMMASFYKGFGTH